MTINKATATWTTSAASKTYGTADASPLTTGSGTGFVAADNVTATYTRAAGETVAGGPYAITATLSPASVLGNYTITNAGASFTINKATTTSTVGPSAASVLLLNNVTFTATVVTSTSGVPTGTVTFMDGTTTLGTATLSPVTPTAGPGLTAAGSLTMSTLAAGTHSISAVYAGDANLTGSTAAAITETVQDFNFTVSGGGTTTTTQSATVLPGGVATYVFQVAPVNGTTFPGTVTLTLTGVPSGASYTITPSTIAAGSGITTVTVTVTTVKSSAALTAPKDGRGFPKPALLALLLPLLGTRKLRRALRAQLKASLLMAVLLGVLLLGMTACGSGAGFFAQPPQSYPMTLTATSGALHHSAILNLTIQ